MEKKFFQEPAVYVGEVNINVTDIDRSIEYYESIIGFKTLERSERKAVLTADGKKPLLVLEQPEDVIPKQGRTTGLFHFAILLPGREDLSSFLRHIAENNVQIGASDHIVSEAIYLSDPDGNGIEVYRDRQASEWSWTNGNVAMATEPLDAQGVLAESDKKWNGLPEETVMGHIHLHVSELKKTEEFYNQMGFKVVTNYPGALFMSTHGYHHHIGLNVWNGEGAPAPAKNSAGLNWFVLEYSEQAAEDAVQKLANIDATVEKVSEGYKTVDPSGNTIILRTKRDD
ncbi:VOC family protein [Evansella sp. LMS18]|jgi:catechol 2,3-dioxygenase|uniref:VOC family protein n=1 Tax=Evansella sp. LMS18 TaxID=2924033 RepID=UPI0020D15B9A|nr:VOC family protein [Evansella sp. LMS18]UTR08914.1 VOC family protein [Evansella sp. LMS18]